MPNFSASRDRLVGDRERRDDQHAAAGVPRDVLGPDQLHRRLAEPAVGEDRGAALARTAHSTSAAWKSNRNGRHKPARTRHRMRLGSCVPRTRRRRDDHASTGPAARSGPGWTRMTTRTRRAVGQRELGDTADAAAHFGNARSSVCGGGVGRRPGVARSASGQPALQPVPPWRESRPMRARTARNRAVPVELGHRGHDPSAALCGPLWSAGSVQTAPIISPSCAWTSGTSVGARLPRKSHGPGWLGASGTGWATSAALARATGPAWGAVERRRQETSTSVPALVCRRGGDVEHHRGGPSTRRP